MFLGKGEEHRDQAPCVDRSQGTAVVRKGPDVDVLEGLAICWGPGYLSVGGGNKDGLLSPRGLELVKKMKG